MVLIHTLIQKINRANKYFLMSTTAIREWLLQGYYQCSICRKPWFSSQYGSWRLEVWRDEVDRVKWCYCSSYVYDSLAMTQINIEFKKTSTGGRKHMEWNTFSWKCNIFSDGSISFDSKGQVIGKDDEDNEDFSRNRNYTWW